MPTLTVAIPVYNGERFIGATLESLVRQTRPPDRVVVMDNCSTDGTRQVVDQFSSLPIEWRQNEANLGHTRNLERSFALASETEYLHVLLADDLIKPPFYERLLTELEAIDGPAIGFTPFELINEHGDRIPPFLQARSASARRVPLNEFLAAQAELRTILIPAILLKKCRQPPPTQIPKDMPQVGDCVLFARWGQSVRTIVEISEPLCQYRMHSAQTTTRHMLDLQAWVLDEWKVMQIVSAMIDEPPWRRRLRRERLKMLFAARSQVKIQTVRATMPDYAAQILRETQSRTGRGHWLLGRAAVAVRDVLRCLAKPSA